MKKNDRVILFIFLCACSWASNAQIRHRDSLNVVLTTQSESKDKAMALHKLFQSTNDQDLELAIEYAQEGLRIASKLSDPHLKAIALTDLGYAAFLQKELVEARRLYEQALTAVKDASYDDYPFLTYVFILDYHRDVGKLDSAQFFADKAEHYLNRASIQSILKYYQSRGWLDFQKSNYKSAIENAERKIELSSAEESPVNLLMTLSHLELEEYDEAAIALDKGFKSHRNNPDSLASRNYVLLLIAKGDVYAATSSYSSAIEYYEQAYKISVNKKFLRLQARAGSHLGKVFEAFGNYPKAIDLYEEALKIDEQYNALQDVARINARIAWALIYSNNTILASQFASRSLNQMRQINDKAGLGFAWNLLGYINYIHKDLSTAMLYYDSALTARESLESSTDYYKTLYNIAEVHAQYGEFDKALSKLNLVLAHEEKNIKDVNNLIFTYNTISKIHSKMGNLRESEKYCLLGYEASKKNQLLPQLKTSLENILDLGIGLKNTSAMARYYNELKKVNDTLAFLEQNNRILQVSALRELEINRMELLELRSQAKLEALKTEKKNQALSFYLYFVVLLIFVLLLLIYIIFIRRQNQKKLILVNKELESKVQKRTKQLTEAYHELQTYFYKSHHDLRGPVSTILGLVSISKFSNEKEETDKLWGMVERTALQQMIMIEKINKLGQVISFEFDNQIISLTEEINLLLEKKQKIIASHNIQISYRLQADKVNTSLFLLRIILENLLDNAIAFSNKENPVIGIESESNEGITSILVIDNGEGINQEISGNLFTIFFRGSTISDGSGLGLYTVKKAVERMGGTISFESTPFKRTVFKLQFEKR